MIAPHPFLTACLEVLYEAAISARMAAWTGMRDETTDPKPNLDYIASVMDAVHNLPKLLKRWESCDEAMVRDYLKQHDDRWGDRLLQKYEAVLAEMGGRDTEAN